MLSRVEDVRGYATRAARSGLFLSTRDQQSVGYRVPGEWASLTEAQRGSLSLSAFKGGRGGVSWPHMGRLSAGRWAVMCVGGPGSELAGWVPHVRALCFDGSDTFEGNRCFFPRYLLLP